MIFELSNLVDEFKGKLPFDELTSDKFFRYYIPKPRT